eukprot:TRINITY_DN15679_c0_g1::TRINITY_DN15679_c0_g1_i1::g.18754::m.18754 TRINITY_DN15679_c0_g1::TRINITY_DN15679_c0_g1_i1::g.18754  ORF type:complete len:262 (+),score=58.97,sp/Q5RKQ0/SPF27_DANRE/31.07/4e-33,BCAS2/PF05700.6/2.4e-55,AcylCoA_dehyd_C/PF12186.3/0.073,Sda/PF08970.5/8.6e+02,Sda/PF08970.5/1.1e+04,Sda/PF08970.5/1.1,IncA/PF04156.9/1.4e+03,IncA/PF04156.9/0.52,KxDL/PF10241.4/3.4e+03,KxDL/PF10241.4/3.4e+03,KxDL/PF10241.4/2.6,DASH_Spc34/PF08657.5/13,Fib_alpha/PF08702.5/2.6e+03,Fib_alpha/PF08702.5/2.
MTHAIVPFREIESAKQAIKQELEREYKGLDSLPYIDHEFNDSAMKAQVESMIAAEMKKFRPRNYMDDFPKPSTVFETSDAIKQELERVAAGKRLDKIDMTKYVVEPPPEAETTNVAAWRQAVMNACVQLEHQNLRSLNLDLMNQYGQNAWRLHNESLDVLLKDQKRKLDDLNKASEEVNKRRKLLQTSAAPKLQGLSQQFVELTNKNLDITQAISNMEKEIQLLQEEIARRNVQTAASGPAPMES